MAGLRGKRPSAGERPPSSSGTSGRLLGALSGGPSGGAPSGRCGDLNGPPSRYLPRFFVESSQAPAPSPSARVPSAAALGQEFVLGPEDAYHALKVLRLGSGDQCEVVVARADPGGGPFGVSGGAAYLAAVTSATDEVRVTPVAPLEGRQAGASYVRAVGIVQAITRPVAMDFLVEKGTEVGASFFLVVPVAGSSSRTRSTQGARLTRWRRIALEAAKQSKQLAMPSVDISGSVAEALEQLGEGALSLVLEPAARDGLYEVVASIWGQKASAEGARPARLALWVGPESGWTGEELARLTAAGAKPVRLGQGVLRAETAGPVAVAVARLALGDW
jgi:16S rRNA (uracil1498-N3)-methyltransferase